MTKFNIVVETTDKVTQVAKVTIEADTYEDVKSKAHQMLLDDKLDFSWVEQEPYDYDIWGHEV